MNDTDKQLLIRDLCARLPYGVKLKIGRSDYLDTFIIYNARYETVSDAISSAPVDKCKPYLFPMSSMTEEQRTELIQHCGLGISFKGSIAFEEEISGMSKYIDWLNERHFDFRGLLERGLGIDATNLNIY